MQPAFEPRESAAPAELQLPGADPSEQLHLRDYLKTIWRRRWAFVTTCLFVIAGTAVYVYSQQPIYRSNSLLLIEPKALTLLNLKEIYDPTASSFFESQIALLNSRKLLSIVAEELRLPLGQLEGGRKVDIVGSSRALVQVGFESPDPEVAARVANSLVQAYIKESSLRDAGISHEGLRRLKEKAEEMRPKQEQALTEFEEYVRAHGLITTEANLDLIQAQIQTLNSGLVEVQVANVEAEVELKSMEDALQRGVDLIDLPTMANNERIDRLKEDLEEQHRRMRALTQTAGPQHPQVLELEWEIGVLEERLRSLCQESFDSLVDQRKNSRVYEETLREQLDILRTEHRELSRQAGELRLLQDELHRSTTMYSKVTERIEEAELALALGSKSHNLVVVDAALPSAVPVRPAKARLFSVGCLLALGLGLGLCFFLEYLDNTLKGQDDTERALGIPVLGFLPAVSVRVEPGEAAELAAIRQPRSAVAESFRTIRTSLLFTMPADARKAVMVTSSSPGEGKTFVAINLAEALAQSGMKVLLVGADLRKPRLVHIYHLLENDGLSMGLARKDMQATLACVQASGSENLDVLVGGPKPPNPAELLSSDAVGQFIDAALKQYDWVVFDCAPVLRVTDPLALLGHVPFCIFVVRAFATPRDGAQRALSLLSGSPSRILGTVMNYADAAAHDAYGYGYGYGYGDEDDNFDEFHARREAALQLRPVSGNNGSRGRSAGDRS